MGRGVAVVLRARRRQPRQRAEHIGRCHQGERDAYIRGRLTLPMLGNLAARRSLQDLSASPVSWGWSYQIVVGHLKRLLARDFPPFAGDAGRDGRRAAPFAFTSPA